MSEIYDNWDRLVAAVLKKQQLWELFHAPSRSPSVLSEASDSSSSSYLWWQGEPPKLVLLSDFSPPFDFQDVNTASAELLGEGTFGSAYSVTINNGVRMVVKRLKSGSISELDFKHHMNTVGNVRHGNVAPLRAYYAFGDERLLLYDHYSNGSVYALLHGQTGAQVDWEARRSIAIGAARAIAEIHRKNGGKLVHGNIKASNVFLIPQVFCCVSDLGLANTVEAKFMKDARCYAPEIKNSKDVSQASDVYSFGILLLELLTRKSSIHIPGGPKAVDLVKLVRSKGASKVLDAELLQNPTIRNDMVSMLEIGIKCVAKSINKRPKMFEVVKMLEDILVHPISHAPSANKLVFLDNVIPRFDIEDLLRASSEVLGKGTFGTSYTARLDDGDTFVVKRLRDTIVTMEGFQQHMEVFGRMKHNNVESIRAYYYSQDEKLVLYHFYLDTSVSALLHGRTSIQRGNMGWKTRLKIATEAAMGIAHIHGEDLVHGNIKSSNIFLLEQNYSIVADAGYTKLTNPIKLSAKRSGYIAPEVTDTWKVSQASDVYSFGVFLIELASGLPSLQAEVTGEDTLLVEWFQGIPAIPNDEWIAEVFDVELLRYENRDEEGMIRFLQIATDCVQSSPQHRPKMPQVVQMLEEINGIGVGVSIESRSEEVLEEVWQQSIESRIEGVLESMLLLTMTE